jgi:hypothetical protein
VTSIQIVGLVQHELEYRNESYMIPLHSKLVYKKYFIFCYVDLWSCQKCGVLCSCPTRHILGIALFVRLPCQCIIKQMAQEMDMLTLPVSVYTSFLSCHIPKLFPVQMMNVEAFGKPRPICLQCSAVTQA